MMDEVVWWLVPQYLAQGSHFGSEEIKRRAARIRAYIYLHLHAPWISRVAVGQMGFFLALHL
jgi:hypothetical protein